jgi:hypothetical protein
VTGPFPYPRPLRISLVGALLLSTHHFLLFHFHLILRNYNVDASTSHAVPHAARECGPGDDVEVPRGGRRPHHDQAAYWCFVFQIHEPLHSLVQLLHVLARNEPSGLWEPHWWTKYVFLLVWIGWSLDVEHATCPVLTLRVLLNCASDTPLHCCSRSKSHGIGPLQQAHQVSRCTSQDRARRACFGCLLIITRRVMN